jgi:hypothetical protein
MGCIQKLKGIERTMAAMARAIDETLTEEHGRKGFALIVFDFGAAGLANYVSNASRETMIQALRETADRLEGRQDIPPAFGRAN